MWSVVDPPELPIPNCNKVCKIEKVSMSDIGREGAVTEQQLANSTNLLN